MQYNKQLKNQRAALALLIQFHNLKLFDINAFNILCKISN
jgi:hypothetical protein